MSGAMETMDTVPPGSETLHSASNPSVNFMTRNDFNNLIMNYLIIEGYSDVCETFRNESETLMSDCSEMMKRRFRIRTAVVNGHIEEAISLVNQLHPGLLDNNPQLSFQMHKQQLVELIRQQQVNEALDFAQAKFADLGMQDGEVLAELEQILALLAFSNPETSPFSHLLLLSQRNNLASELNRAILEVGEETGTTESDLVQFYRLLHWIQQELDQNKVSYHKMVDCSTATMQPSI